MAHHHARLGLNVRGFVGKRACLAESFGAKMDHVASSLVEAALDLNQDSESVAAAAEDASRQSLEVDAASSQALSDVQTAAGARSPIDAEGEFGAPAGASS